MSPRVTARVLAVALVGLVLGAAAAVLEIQRRATAVDAKGEAYVAVQQRAGEAVGAALRALRRDREAQPARSARRLRREAERLAEAHPDDLLLVTTKWAARELATAAQREQRALDAFDVSTARTVVIEEVAWAHERIQRLVGGARLRQERRAATAAARADRLSGAVLIGLLLSTGAMGVGWLVLHRRADRDAFARSRARTFAALSRGASDLLTVLDDAGVITAQASTAEAVLGPGLHRLEGRAFTALVHPDDRGLMPSLLELGLVEWRLRDADSVWVHVETRATDLRDDPNVRGLVLITRDISQRKAIEQRLRHHAFHDPLTQLPNRVLFEDRLEHALMASRRHGRPVALLYVDLDDFKLINDSFGHRVGDDVLLAVAARLGQSVRGGDTVARLGGDEFAVLLESVTDPDEPAVVLERVLAAFEEPVLTTCGEVTTAPSIGMAVSGDGIRSDELVEQADRAMYEAKRATKGMRAANASLSARRHDSVTRRTPAST